MKRTARRSIKSILIRNFSIGVSIAFILIFLATFTIVEKDIKNIKEQSISRMLADGADTITARIDIMFATAQTVAADPVVSNPNISFEDKRDILTQYAAERNIMSIGYISGEGYLTGTDGFENDISQKQYCIDLLKGIPYISHPQFNTVSQSQIIFIGVPRYYNGQIVGAMTCCFDSTVLSDLVEGLRYMEKGRAYMISDTGLTIASDNMDDVLNNYNILEAAAEDSSLAKAAEVSQYMIDTEKGITSLGSNLLFFDKVQDGANWTLVFEIPKSQFNSEIYTLMAVLIGLAVVGIIIIVAISFTVGSKLGNRLTKLSYHLEQVAHGDFTTQLEEKDSLQQDEIGDIYRNLSLTIRDIGKTLTGMKEVTSDLANQVAVLNKTSSILENGSLRVSDSVGDITAGNSEQASEITTINSEMEKFSVNVERINDDIGTVVEITSSANSKLSVGHADMNHLKDSFLKFNENFNDFRVMIEQMNESLHSINMITSTISEIAEETNLLSLNASIEAARAGDAGKGFGVVAMEIAKLAEQCGASVQEITQVVGDIIKSGSQLIDSTSVMDDQMKEQNQIITTTISSFDELAHEITEMSPQINSISHISKDNLDACQVIGKSIQNVSDISTEVLSTTLSVSDTSESFSNSSRDLGEASQKLQNISDELSRLAENFIV